MFLNIDIHHFSISFFVLFISLIKLFIAAMKMER